MEDANDVELDYSDTPIAPQPPSKARLTYWGNVSYQYPDHTKEPITVEIRHSVEVASEEQVYVRYLTADLSWRKVDTGWVPSPSLLIIKNTEPARHGGVLLISFRDPYPLGDILLPPGKAFVGTVSHTDIFVAAPVKKTSYSITAIPR